MTLLGQPEPLQPSDTLDEILRLEAWHGVYLDRVEFKCSICGETYWRRVVHTERVDQMIEVEGIGLYGLNPHMEDTYEPNPHVEHYTGKVSI